MVFNYFFLMARNGHFLCLGSALWASLIFVCLWSRTADAIQTVPFVLGAYPSDQQPLVLDEVDRQWLEARKVLRVGISVLDHEPVDITTDRNRYQGISADYLSLMSTRLAIPVQVRGFAKRAHAVDALLAGEIDLLSSASGFERAIPGLSFTQAYLQDRAVVFGRGSDPGLQPSLKGKRVILQDGYADLEQVQQIYPDSEIMLAPTLHSAMEALAQNDADAFVANELTVQSYSLLRPHLGLQTKFDSLLPSSGFSFAFRETDTQALQLFDHALAGLDEAVHREIQARWTLGLGADLTRRQVNFSAPERKWIRQHPQVIVASTQHPPYIYKDAHGRWVGLNIDVLARISRMTGLQFIHKKSPSTEALLKTLSEGDADMNTTLAENVERKRLLDFTYAFGGNNWVFLVRAEQATSFQLSDMTGKVLALPARHALLAFIRERYPQIQLKLVPTYEDARRLVEEGNADATIQNEAGAWLYPSANLRVGRSVEGMWSPDRFSVVKTHPQLLGILNKALEEFPVGEMRAIRLKWLGAPSPQASLWRRVPAWVYWVVSTSLLVGLVSLAWSSRLKYQAHQRLRAEAQLGDQLAFRRTLLDAIANPIHVRDLQGRLVACNRSYEESFGISYEQMQGRRLIDVDLLPRDHAERMHEAFMTLLDTQTPVFSERTLQLAGRQVDVWLWMVPYHRADGQLQGLIGGWADIGERKRLEAELKDARHAAEQTACQLKRLLVETGQARTPDA